MMSPCCYGDGLGDITVLLTSWEPQLKVKRGTDGVYDCIVSLGSVNPIAILNGHEKTITCVAVSASHGLVASGAKRIQQ